MEDVRKIVGKNLKKIRKQKQYTQGELANCLDIQVRQLARIEAGTSFIQHSITNGTFLKKIFLNRLDL